MDDGNSCTYTFKEPKMSSMVDSSTNVRGFHVLYTSEEYCNEETDAKMTVDLRFVCDREGSSLELVNQGNSD